MTLLQPEPLISGIVTDLAACLCAQVAEDTGPLCFCGVIPGPPSLEFIGEDCWEGDQSGCGIGYVRMLQAYAAAAVGQVSRQLGDCGNSLGYDIEVGIYRCFTLPEDFPDPSAWLAMSLQQQKDIRTIRRAITCCGSLDPSQFIIGPYQPADPAGGVYGVTCTLYVLEE